jgi:hypothetical protein
MHPRSNFALNSGWSSEHPSDRLLRDDAGASVYNADISSMQFLTLVFTDGACMYDMMTPVSVVTLLVKNCFVLEVLPNSNTDFPDFPCLQDSA